MRNFAYGAHDAIGVARFEQLDRLQGPGDVRKEPLQLIRGRGLRRAPRLLEWMLFRSARQGQLVQHDDPGVREIQRGITRLGRDRYDAMTAIECVVGKPLILASKEQRDETA